MAQMAGEGRLDLAFHHSSKSTYKYTSRGIQLCANDPLPTMFSSGSPKPSSGGTQRSNTSLSKVRPLIYSDSLELISNPGSAKSSRKLIPPIDDHVVQAFKPVKTGLPLYFANGSLGEMENLNTVDHDGLSALHRAVRVNNVQDVKNMLDYGADINLKDKDGFTPIHTAVRYVGLINARIPKGVMKEMQIRYILAWCALVIWQAKAYFECACFPRFCYM